MLSSIVLLLALALPVFASFGSVSSLPLRLLALAAAGCCSSGKPVVVADDETRAARNDFNNIAKRMSSFETVQNCWRHTGQGF